jgi:hypothetical protein
MGGAGNVLDIGGAYPCSRRGGSGLAKDDSFAANPVDGLRKDPPALATKRRHRPGPPHHQHEDPAQAGPGDLGADLGSGAYSDPAGRLPGSRGSRDRSGREAGPDELAGRGHRPESDSGNYCSDQVLG